MRRRGVTLVSHLTRSEMHCSVCVDMLCTNKRNNQTQTHTQKKHVAYRSGVNILNLSVSHQISTMVSEASREGLTEAALNRYNTHSPSHTNSPSHTSSPSHTPAVTTTAATTTSAAASFFAR